MSLKVNKTIEEVKSYIKNKFEVVDDDNKVSWKARFTEDQLDTIEEMLTDKIEENLEYRHLLEIEVYSKLKFILPKTEIFNAEMLGNQPIAIKMIADEIFKMLELDKVKVKQTKLEMPKQ